MISGLGRSPVYPLQYSVLENAMDRGAWQATVHWVINNCTQLSLDTTERLSLFMCVLKVKNIFGIGKPKLLHASRWVRLQAHVLGFELPLGEVHGG